MSCPDQNSSSLAICCMESMLFFEPQGIQSMLLYMLDKLINKINNGEKRIGKNQAKGELVRIIVTYVIRRISTGKHFIVSILVYICCPTFFICKCVASLGSMALASRLQIGSILGRVFLLACSLFLQMVLK